MDFYSEISPLGVIGSFLLDRQPKHSDIFRFKHHYLLHTLDSQILFHLFSAMNDRCWVELSMRSMYRSTERLQRVYPCRIHISAQTGRQYLLGFSDAEQDFRFFRLDTIRRVRPKEPEPQYGVILEKMEAFSKKLWGVAVKKQGESDHLEMIIYADPSDSFIAQRLIREKRNGTVTALGENTYLYQTDVYDALEMLPWIRTFIGRIEKLECSNTAVTERFCQDLDAMAAMYGGD